METQESAGCNDDGFHSFLQALEGEKDGMPADTYQQIMGAMHKRYQSPPLHDLEAVLHRPVPVQKARQLLFYPESEDMALYVRLLTSPPAGAPDTHPQHKMQILSLSMLYLVHGRSWARIRPFIEAGGLLRLVDLVAHSNLYLASQAMHCLLTATDEDLYPWHDPHGDGTRVTTGPDKLLWQRMFQLSKTPLIEHLMKHHNPDTFPGSGLLALRLFAFLASWLRYHFTEDRVLRLSSELLHTLKQWSELPGLQSDEHTLATQLYQDFSRHPPAETSATSGPQLGTNSQSTQFAEDALEDVRTVHDASQVNHVEPSPADVLRTLGNDAYKQGDYTQAIRRYSEALDVPVPGAELLTEGPRRATLLSNRAAAYLARAAAGGGQPGDCDVTGLMEGWEQGTSEACTKHYEAALIDAQAALDLEPSHLKAQYRKAQALYWLCKYDKALAAAECAAATARRGEETGSCTAAMRKEISSLCDDITSCMKIPSTTLDEAAAAAAAAVQAGTWQAPRKAAQNELKADSNHSTLQGMLLITPPEEGHTKTTTSKVKAPLIQELCEPGHEDDSIRSCVDQAQSH